MSRDHLSIDIDQGDEGGDTDSNKTEVNTKYLSIDIDQGDEGGDTDSNKTEVNTLLKELLDGVAPS